MNVANAVASVADAEAVGVATMGAEAAGFETADAAAADAAALELSLLCGTTFLDFLVIALRRVAAFRFSSQPSSKQQPSLFASNFCFFLFQLRDLRPCSRRKCTPCPDSSLPHFLARNVGRKQAHKTYF